MTVRARTTVLTTPNDEKKIQNFSTVCDTEVGNCGFLSNAAYICKEFTINNHNYQAAYI